MGAPEEAPATEPEVLETVALLVKLGADANAVDSNGETAMHGAAYRNHPKVVQLLAAAYHPDRIYLFGSVARGDAGQDSDYDLLIVVPDNASPERRGSRLAYRALRGTGTAADVLVCTTSYFENRRSLKASLPGTVLREGRLLHVA